MTARCRLRRRPDSVVGRSQLPDYPRQAVGYVVPSAVIGRSDEFPTNTDVASEALRYGAHIRDIDQFDAEFFRISPVEAQMLDPQQRMMLETSWQALEDAGIDPERIRNSRTGIYAGMSSNDYREATINSAETVEVAAGLYACTGTALSTAIGRVSYALGLEGPAITLDTACSSALVAIQQAIGGLERRETDLAIAGGVNIHLSGRHLDLRANAGMLSPTGQCWTFDAAADGFVCGEGCGLVVLKRLSDAEADGDRIWAVIRGSSVNQDGASQGLTVPNGNAQKRAIEEALIRAGAAPWEIDYLEAHGTGTVVGDPIEVTAAAEVYQEGRERGRPLLIGSVKTNIGHLGPAAGVAGLIKTVLAMRHGLIPPHLNFKNPNPRIDWDNLPIRVTDAETDWPAHPSREPLAAVNSFGWSGTNAHVVVEGYDAPDAGGSDASAMSFPVGRPLPVSETDRPDAEFAARETRMLPLSGKSPEALRDLASRYLSWLDGHTDEIALDSAASGAALSDVSWTAATNRSHFPYRAGIAFSDAARLREALLALSERADGWDRAAPRETAKIAFVFTGQGSQWVGMGQALYEREPVFRGVLDECDGLLLKERGVSLLDVMFGRNGTEGLLDEPAWTQPAIYSLECALAALWDSCGVRPDAVVGHSMGEIAAAQTAGALTLEEGLRYAAVRGELLGATRSDGAMAAVFAPAARVASVVAERNAVSSDVDLSVAVDNGPQQVISGPAKDLEAVLEVFEAEGVNVIRLRRSPAYHSALLDPALDALENAVADIIPAPSALELPLVSNITGQPLNKDERMNAAYWRRHARSPVAFRRCVETLAEMNVDVVVEVGPHAVLGPVVSMTWPAGSPVTLASLRRPPRDESEPVYDASGGFVEAVAGAYAAGLTLKFTGLFAGERRRRVAVPGYPFQRRRHWVRATRRQGQTPGHPLLGVRHESPRGEVTFDTEMFPTEPAWLLDHLVFGRVVAPGGMYGAMAVSAFFEDGDGPVAVDDMQTYSALIFQEFDLDGSDADAGRQLQFVMDGPADAATRRFEIYSKGKSEQGWTLHAEGSLTSGREDAQPINLDELRSELQPVNVADFYRSRYSDEISLGPAYHTVRSIYSAGGQALGELALRDSVDANGAALHPLLLDGCFQVLSAARYLSGVEQGAVYMPFGWERLWVAGPMPERIACHAVLRNPPAGGGTDEAPSAPPEVVTGDVVFYSLDGVPLGGLKGFTVKRATRSALLSAGESVNDLLYEPVWRDKPFGRGMASADFLTAPAEVAARTRLLTEYMVDAGITAREKRTLLDDIERLAQAYVLSAFEKMGWERKAGAAVSAEELRPRLQVSDEHRRLFDRLLGLLSEAGILTPAGEGFFIAIGAGDPLPDPAIGDADSLAEQLKDRHPYGVSELGLLSGCGPHLAEVLQGSVDPLSLLFGNDGASATDYYFNSPTSMAAANMLKDAIASAVSGLPDHRRLRVLEVGAGTGSAADAALASLPPGRFDYTYTDISAGFFAPAEERLAATGASIEYRTLDIESDPVGQGFDPRGYDLVIAANVLHATRNLGETLTHCRELLAPSGQLVALEVLRRSSWQDLTFGLLDGWWRFDDDYRLDNPLATPALWRKALADAGFSDVAVLGMANPDTDELLGANIIIARGPADAALDPGIWILTADESGAAAELSARLAERNQTALLAGDAVSHPKVNDGSQRIISAVVDPTDRLGWHNLLMGLPRDLPLKGVVHLAALDGHGGTASAPEMAQDVKRASASALALMQGILDAGATPTDGVWFVTRGGQTLEQDLTSGASGELAGAALWGFGKVIAVETGYLRPRLIDLDPVAGESITGNLIDEILFPDAETRVAYRDGYRYASRLVRADLDHRQPSQPEGTEHEVEPTVLEIDLSDRTYLVTGGMGGIGCAVARWLAENGAGTIVLNGRRSPTPEAEAVIRELRANGADVRVEVVDVTNAATVDDMLARIENTMLPLGGIMHCVGVLSDGAIGNQNWERFEQVLCPKILGAWHLHRATIDRDLDMFVMFSSITGVLGNPGQTNHASANAFLDQLAAHRRTLGLAGQSIAWGAWLDIGEAEEQRERITRQLAYYGTKWITPEQGIKALEQLVRHDVANATVTATVDAADWAIIAEGLQTHAPFVEELLVKHTAPVREREARSSSSSSDLLDRLKEASTEQRQSLLVSFVQEELKAALRMASQPSPTVSFFDFGMDSLMAVELRNRINRALAGEYTASNTVVFDFPTAASLAEFLSEQLGSLDGFAPTSATRQASALRTPRTQGEDERIAIVGMACRFPGAPDLDAFWRLLEEGGNAVTEGRPDPGIWKGILGDPEAEEPLYRRGAFLEGIDRFDSAFFRIAPIEARLMDPQHRMLLETSWQVLEDAGVDPEQLRGTRTGIFAGVGSSSGYREIVAASGQGYSIGEAIAVGRVAFALGLEGPAVPLDLACASSLAAVHQAVVSLQRGEVDMALAGGVNVTLSIGVSEFLGGMGMLSQSGQCNAFDAAADGFVRGEGCGMVALKRLSDAEADGDRIWGVVLGTAVNQNGMSASLMAPNGRAQERAMEEALARAGVLPSDVDYLEAQGVGSEFGDPIEMNAAASVYGRGRDAERPLIVGSVKTNIGHLEWASGIASLIKTVLAMRRRVVPRNLHFNNPSPLVEWDRLPVAVASDASQWPSNGNGIPLAAVNSYGLSGTNANVVVGGFQRLDAGNELDWPAGAAQPIPAPIAGSDSPAANGDFRERVYRFLPLSGKSPDAVRDLAELYSRYLDKSRGESLPAEAPAHHDLADVAWTAGIGRSHFACRAGVVFRDISQLRQGLQELAASEDETAAGQPDLNSSEPGRAAFVYTGEAGPWLRSGQYLYETEPVFREVLDRCNEQFIAERGVALLDVIFEREAEGDETDGSASRRPAVYAMECALTALWKSVGVNPDTVVGHALGKIAAVQAAGSISLEDGLRLATISEDPARAIASFDLSPASVILVNGADGKATSSGRVPEGKYWNVDDEGPPFDCAGALADLGVGAVIGIGAAASVATRESNAAFVAAVAKAYEAGVNIDFAGLFNSESRRRAPLPGYPFQRRRHWVDGPKSDYPTRRSEATQGRQD